jgi:hypothetical protein
MRSGRFMQLIRCAALIVFSGLLVSVCTADCGKVTQPTMNSNLQNLPVAIQKLAKDIQGKKGDELASIIAKDFGPAARDVGSGVSIQQWDVESGVLTLSRGLVSFRASGRKPVWLTATVSKALPSLLAETFEMYTLPSPQMKYWLGNLSLRTDSRYEFVDSGSNLDHRGDQTQNLFIKHPDGRFAIHFAPGCTADTVLEHLPDGTTLGSLTFSPANDGPDVNYEVVVYASEKRLVFSSKDALSFSMGKQWVATN